LAFQEKTLSDVLFPRPLARLLLTALFALGPLAAPARAAVPAGERAALKALYNTTGGARWTNRLGWLGAAGTECSWFGVQCDVPGSTVTGLDLEGNGLAGTLPSLAGLPDLQVLHLGLNQISGALSGQLGNLRSLQVLDLPFNRISGGLPAELGGLASLRLLNLGGNQLSGGLPPQLGSLQALTYLDLSSNQLGGVIPAALGQLANLQTLYLDDNQLTGEIPAALGSLAAIEQLSLSGNQLAGRIPRELGNLPQLMFLNLEGNQLGGSVPPELGNDAALVGLLLSSNHLGGTIPGSLINLANLETLWLDHNRFTGPVPFELGALPGLDDNGGLDLRSNALATDTEPGLLADLNAKQLGGNWTSSQAASAVFDPQFSLDGLADRRPGGFMVWTLTIGAGAPPLAFSTNFGTGDVDLYVRFGAPPTATQFDASSANTGNLESITITSPKAGTWYVGLRARSPYTGVTLQGGAERGVCLPGDTSLCVNGGRFEVEATWRTRDGRTGPGHAVALTPDTGYFWFFDPANVETVVKVLDGCAVNGKVWVFAGGLTDVQVDLAVTDTRAIKGRVYHNPQGTAFQPIQDTSAFDACGAPPPVSAQAAVQTLEVKMAADRAAADLERIVEAAASCAAGPTSLCLSGGRFRVDVTWKTPDGHTGAGQAVPLTADTGYFWFFSASNVEMVIKVLNACGYNSRFWVYAGGLTNVQVNVTVTDTQTGAAKTYANPQGTAFRPVQDTSAFSTCP
jgi:hypothetical protein